MNIAVFEVRKDEQEELARLKQRHNLNLHCFSGPLTDPSQLPDSTEAVSTLGQSQLTAPLLAALAEKGVRALSTRTIGYNHIDLEGAKAAGIRVLSASYPADGVADFTIMLMLMTLRHYKPALWRQQVNDYSLGGLMGRELCHQTVGVIGAGRIGSTVIRSLQGFGCTILANNPSPRPELEGMASFLPLEEVIRQSDIITVHLPLTPESYHMIDRETLATAKDGVILINTARGGLMKLHALIERIESEKIGALAMDVFENEDGIYHQNRKTDILRNQKMAYLRQFPNVVLTQHMAFYTDTNVRSMVDCGIEGLLTLQKTGSAPTLLV